MSQAAWISAADLMKFAGDFFSVSDGAFLSNKYIADPVRTMRSVETFWQNKRLIAMRRTEDGSWLEVSSGWISVDSVGSTAMLCVCRFLLLESMSHRDLLGISGLERCRATAGAEALLVCGPATRRLHLVAMKVVIG